MIWKNKFTLTFLLLILFGLLLYLCYQENSHQNPILRYRPTGLNSHFDPKQFSSFENYVQQSQTIIKKARALAQVDNSSAVVAQNAPEIFIPPTTCKKTADGKYERGILLIHGLLDSAYVMRPLGKYLQSQCFIVYSLLLPGDGTTPGDLTEVTADDWKNATDFGFNQLKKVARDRYIGGYSLGGLLGILLEQEHPRSVKSLLLFAPALGYSASWISPLIPIVYALGHMIPLSELTWIERRKDTNPIKYQSFPANAVYQLNRVMKQVNQTLEKTPLNTPIFVVQSADDPTIDAQATLHFFKSDTSPLSRMIWFSQIAQPMKDPRIHTIISQIPSLHIISMSHVSLLYTESDPYFGRQGKIKECFHYEKNTAAWDACESGKNIEFGATTKKNLARYTLRQLTYNPFFNQMLEALGRFLNNQ